MADRYQLAAMEAQAWQDEAARNDRAMATKLRAIADIIEPRASLIAGRPVSDTSKAAAREIVKQAHELRAIADGLTAAR